MSIRNYSNTGSLASLANPIGATDTSIVLSGLTGVPAAPFTASIGRGTGSEELVLVTAVAGSTVTVTRGYDGTSAQAQSGGTSFQEVVAAIDFREANTHINGTGGAHGTSSQLVGVSDTQTLTNKTLTAPTISSPTVTGTASMAAVTGTTASFTGTVSSAGKTLTRHWGQGAVFPTTGLVAGDRYIHTLYGSVAGSMSGAGINGYHAYTEFVWNGYSWRQTHVTTVEGQPDRSAMTNAVIAAGAAAQAVPGMPAPYFHDGFEVMETAGNRRYQWDGSKWMLLADANTGNITATPTLSAGWGSATTNSLTMLPNGMALLSTTATRTGAALSAGSADGNIANTSLVTIPAAWQPAASVGASSAANGYVAVGVLTTGGDLQVTSVSKSSGVAVGDVIQMVCLYPLADPMLLIGQ